ncbi:hypothetical protein Tsubulata_000655, partial [Turnera subulata]
NSDRRKLVQVLRAATTPSRTVIMTIVDKSWARPGSILDLFLESFRTGDGTKFYLKHLVIVALDSQAFQYSKDIHPHCYHLKTAAHFKPFTSFSYLILNKRRNELLLEVVELGYSVVYTDADVMWLRNPLPHFQIPRELSIACDSSLSDASSEGESTDGGFGGFFHLMSSDVTVEFFHLWKLVGVLYPRVANLSLCEISRDTKFVQSAGFRIKFVEADYYGEFCRPSRNISKTYTMHANCCNNLESKVHDLKLVLHALANPEKSKDGTLHQLFTSGNTLKCLTR